MTLTELSKWILDKADSIKKQCHAQALCASHIAVAVAEFCKTKYVGFSISDMTYLPSRFEEERLRYLFSKEVKLTSYFNIRLSKNTKEYVQEEPFDMDFCQRIASLRDTQILSSDVVFLCALSKLHESYRPAVRSAGSEASIMLLLQDADANIYSYVIEQISAICSELKKKSDEAVARRDWKPAAKFTEPENLAAMFFEKIQHQVSGNIAVLKFPNFFGAANLKLSIHKAKDIYHIHDNGCTIQYLSKQLGDQRKLERVLKKVCHCCRISNRRIVGNFVTARSFLYYLQRLILIANADLYYTKLQEVFYPEDTSDTYIDAKNADPMDICALLRELKSSINFHYDENQGLYYWLETSYPFADVRCTYQIETLDQHFVHIRDARKGNTQGQVFEAFYWDNDNIARYSKFIIKITDRFGCKFNGTDIGITDKKDQIFRAMLRFFSACVILSEFGHTITVSKPN